MYFEDAKLKCAEGTASATEILDRLRCSGPGEKLSFVYWSQRISGGNEQHRNPKSSVYADPIRYAWTMHNPITAVRTSSQRLRDPEFLSPKELQALLRELEPRKCTMVLLDASTACGGAN